MRYAIALGSNIGDRVQYLRQGVGGFSRVCRASSVYLTSPLDSPLPQRNFLNMVIIVEDPRDPFALLEQCHKIEQLANRTREIRNGPRTLDVDIVCGESVVLDTPELTLPHPRAAQRAFVMAPLREIDPKWAQWVADLGASDSSPMGLRGTIRRIGVLETLVGRDGAIDESLDVLPGSLG